MSLLISRVAAACGTNAPTIRYYESIGLLVPAQRTAKGRRIYGWPDVARLRFIRRARSLGMTLEQVRELLTASDAPTVACAPAVAVIERHLRAIQKQRVELRLLEGALRGMLDRCQDTCAMGNAPSCSILDDLAAER